MNMQLEFFDVPSPCVGICQSNDKGQCLGCFRTREERQKWTSVSSDEKQKVIKRCIQRKKRQDNKAVDKVAAKEDEQIIQPSLLEQPVKIKIESPSDLDFDDFEL